MTSNSENHLRPLGAVERLFWLLDQNRPTHFAMAAEVEGEIDPAGLAAALRTLSDDNPLLTACIVADDAGRPAFHDAGFALVPTFLHAGADWTEAMASELDARFDAAVGPLFRLSVLPGAGRQVLLMTVHHSIADGVSGANLLMDLLSILAGRPSRGRRLAEALESRVAPAPEVEAAEAPVFRHQPLPYRLAGQSTHVAARRVDRDATRGILSAARAEGASVHGALCAAFSEAYAKRGVQSSGGPTRLLTPIDVRRRLFGGDSSLAMYVNAIAVGMSDPELPFWERAREFSSRHDGLRTAEGVTGGVQAVDRAMVDVTSVEYAAGVWAQVFGAELLLSNLGDLGSGEPVGGLRMTSLWGPAVSMGLEGEQAIGASTYDGRLHLVHVSAEPVAGLLDEIAAILKLASHAEAEA